MPEQLITCILALIGGLTITIVTIATAWIFYRPIFGMTMLISAGILTYLTLICDWKIIVNEIAEIAAKVQS